MLDINYANKKERSVYENIPLPISIKMYQR